MLTTTVGDLVQDAAGDDRLELTLTGQVHRSDFGMRFPATSNAIVSDKVVLTLQISAVRQR
jgi:polyisoprenoid-binding protein YceI